MKYSLLELVQTVLSSMGSDEVNSIGDTVESQQVATIVRTVYFDVISRADLPKNKGIYELVASADGDVPVVMYKPATAYSLEWLKYDLSEEETDPRRPEYAYVTILPNRQFLDMVHKLNPEQSYVDQFTLDDFIFYFRVDKFPSYCTVLNNGTVVFDSINLDFDTTLQSDKTMAYGLLTPVFEMEDSFIPDLDDQQFNLLLNQSKILAFAEIKQTAHDVAIQEARRQWRTYRRTKNYKKENPLDAFANFGRK